MPASPIEQKAISKAIVRIADELVPPERDLAAMKAAGLAYIGVGMLRVRSRWDVDREGNVRFGATTTARVDVAKLVEAAVAGGIPPVDVGTKVQHAIEKASTQEGGGIYECMFLPLVVPSAQIDQAMQTLNAVFIALAGRVEPAA